MRALLFTTGSPFARAVRIILDELGLDYERREEITTPSLEQRAASTPTLQVPTFWDGDLTLWESGLIAEYLLSRYPHRTDARPPLAQHAWRPMEEWRDKLVFATIQTFGNAATTISQMTWTGVGVSQNAHLERSAAKLTQTLSWLESELEVDEDGFIPGCVSVQDIFLAAHVRFVQARPLGVDLEVAKFERTDRLLSSLDGRHSFKANPVYWWEPGVVMAHPSTSSRGPVSQVARSGSRGVGRDPTRRRTIDVTRKLYIKTFGCQMNVYDSERMAEALTGYETTERPEDADLILLNTCHIREKAAEKVYSDLGRLKPLKAANPNLRIGVTGCVAQAEGAEIVARQPLVDLVVGPQSYHRLPELEALARAGKRAIDTEFPEEDKFDRLPQTRRAKGPTAFLTVQEGCDKFCAFCVVPYTRGAEVSRPAERVIAEARTLVDAGVREVTLLGQNVNAYHADGWTLARLIRALAKVDGLDRIRYTTSHPNDMSDDLIAAHAEVPELMPYLHLPVQSGSDRILKRMNRKHTADSYLRLIERIRAARPDIALSGDFIVGFPEETEADFADTLSLIEAVGYAAAYSFKYSSRPGTPAANRPLVDEAVSNERLQRVQALIAQQQRITHEAMVGRETNVLFERAGRGPGQMVGKSEYLQAVHVEGGVGSGDLRRVRITGTSPNSLAGVLT